MGHCCPATDTQRGRPSAIVANTIKGKGVSFLEGQAAFHNGPLTDEQLQLALAETRSALELAEAL